MAVPILMYHSIADDGPGPVSLAVSVFREQLAVLSEQGAHGVTVSDYVSARRTGQHLPPGSVVITFDDAYEDFAATAWPELQTYGWRATLFIPILPVDADRLWDCGDGHRRRLMGWPTIAALSADGVECAAHSMSHADLTSLPPEDARREIVSSGRRLQEQTRRVVAGFAPPGGRMTPALRDEIAHHYTWCVGTRMNPADERADLFDLPRIEMWYFRDVKRWRRYVTDGWTPYFGMRKMLRAAKEAGRRMFS